MTVFSLAYTLHVLAAMIWVGGMFFAWMILRPAAMAALDGPARLKLWVNVFQRFFVWVWVAVSACCNCASTGSRLRRVMCRS